jgi:hypothetical protein
MPWKIMNFSVKSVRHEIVECGRFFSVHSIIKFYFRGKRDTQMKRDFNADTNIQKIIIDISGEKNYGLEDIDTSLYMHLPYFFLLSRHV